MMTCAWLPLISTVTGNDRIAVVLGIVLGIFFMAAAIGGWDWFFSRDEVSPALGNGGARVFYGLLGAFTIGGMLYFVFRD